MVEGAGVGLMQQSCQDLALWKCFSYICCAQGGKSWLCRTFHARHVEKDILLEVDTLGFIQPNKQTNKQKNKQIWRRIPQITRWQDTRYSVFETHDTAYSVCKMHNTASGSVKMKDEGRVKTKDLFVYSEIKKAERGCVCVREKRS